nr:hypothetical protein CFP56_51588 [Quercus suber]
MLDSSRIPFTPVNFILSTSHSIYSLWSSCPCIDDLKANPSALRWIVSFMESVMGALAKSLDTTATGKVLYGYICSKINSSFNLQSNLDVLVKEMDILLDRSKEVKDDKEVIEREGNKIRGQVIKWLDDVEKL